MGSRNGFCGIECVLTRGELAGEFRGTAPYPAAPPDIIGTGPPASASSLPLPGTGGSYRYATSG
jgi:hypothetical protein